MAEEIHEGAVGVEVVCTFVDQDGSARDITGATTLEVDIRKPDGTVLTRTLTPSGSPTNEAKYVTVAADLDAAGSYTFQGYAVIDGKTFFSDTHNRRVRPNLKTSRA